MEILSFMSANPWLSFFCLFIISVLATKIISAIKESYIHTIWCIRGIPPVVKFDNEFINALDKTTAKITKPKEEDDENKLKDCR